MSTKLNARREGFALALTILMIAGLAVLASGAIMMGMNSTLIRNYNVRQDELESAANAGIELARARLNSNRALYPQPDSGYFVLERDSIVRGPSGVAIPNTFRSTYVAPIGITSGQYGVHGAVVTVVRNGPNTLIRRAAVVQQSFSRFAYFTDDEGPIVFGGGDRLFGPTHSNDDITIHWTGATFDGPVTTARTIINDDDGVFLDTRDEGVAPIPLPQVAQLTQLQAQAAAGSLSFTTNNTNAEGRARLRLEFVAIDLNSDGDNTDDNEGFVRVYSSSSADWVVGANPVGNLRNSRNCGHRHTSTGLFVSANSHGTSGSDDWVSAVTNNRVCYLGGAPEITNGWVSSNADGQWLVWPGTVAGALSGRPDRTHLFPLSRELNNGFKGVIYVNGDVAVSGTLRSRVTIAASGNIVIADDLIYSVNPATGNCRDILGLFAGDNVVVPRTPLTTPWQRGNGNNTWYTYDDTPSERIEGFILTLNTFTVEAFGDGPTNAEDCESTNWGRGCLYLVGGIIQANRGAVGQADGSGYLKRYSYDSCGETQPPPYFPTTGRFDRGAYYEVDPTGFNIDAYFASLIAGG
jgi:hypothetical protein